jgi:hypothetical protein
MSAEQFCGADDTEGMLRLINVAPQKAVSIIFESYENVPKVCAVFVCLPSCNNLRTKGVRTAERFSSGLRSGSVQDCGAVQCRTAERFSSGLRSCSLQDCGAVQFRTAERFNAGLRSGSVQDCGAVQFRTAELFSSGLRSRSVQDCTHKLHAV